MQKIRALFALGKENKYSVKTVCLHTKDEIEAFLRCSTFLHLYSLGDLDDFFWQHTTWYALKDHQQVKQLVLLYSATSLPVLLGLSELPTNLLEDLLHSIIPLLPKRFYAHLSGNVASIRAQDYQIKSHGVHYKMALTNSSYLNNLGSAKQVMMHCSSGQNTK